MVRVAIVGPDGSGKSSVVRGVQARLGDRAATVYMGLNPRAGGALLPTTRLRDRLRADPGGPPPETPRDPRGARAPRGIGRLGPVRMVRASARLANRCGEYVARHLRIAVLERRGRIVLLDRDLLFDYDATDVRPPHPPLERRLHGLVLTRLPRPDLVVLLDAPAELLFERKGEWSVEYLERRRQDYRAALRHASRFSVLDASRPLDAVVDAVVELVEDAARRAAKPDGSGEG